MIGGAETFIYRLESALPGVFDIQKATSLPGVAFGVSFNGNPILTKCIGSRHVGRGGEVAPFNEDTMVNIASVSKGFLAAAVGILVHEKRLSWNDPVAMHLPEFRNVHDPTRSQRLTIMDMLSHQSGLARYDMLWYGLEGTQLLKKEDLLHVVNHLPFHNTYKTPWGYNNLAVCVVGLVIEKVQELPFHTFVHERILQPLGLQRTTLTNSFLDMGNYASPHVILDDGRPVPIPQPLMNGETALSPAGAVRTSIRDLLQWGNAWLSALRLEQYEENGSQVTNVWTKESDTLELSITGPQENPLREVQHIMTGRVPLAVPSGASYEATYGMGFARYTMPNNVLGIICSNGRQPNHVLGKDSPPLLTIQHNGMYTGFNTAFYIFPASNICVSVMGNAYGRGDSADWIAWHLIQEIFGLHPKLNILDLSVQRLHTVMDKLPGQKREYLQKQIQHTPRPPNADLVGKYWSEDFRMSLEVDEEGVEGIIFITLNQLPNQRRRFEHYHYDVYGVLAALTTEEYLCRAMVDYAVWESCLLKFVRNWNGHVCNVEWVMDSRHDPVSFVRV